MECVGERTLTVYLVRFPVFMGRLAIMENAIADLQMDTLGPHARLTLVPLASMEVLV